MDIGQGMADIGQGIATGIIRRKELKRKEEEERTRIINDLIKQRLSQGERAIIPEQTQSKGQLTTGQLPARIEQYGIKSPLMGITGSEKITTTTPAHAASEPEIADFILN